jgi:hypothetical protein
MVLIGRQTIKHKDILMTNGIPPELQDLINDILAHKNKEKIENFEELQENLYIDDEEQRKIEINYI